MQSVTSESTFYPPTIDTPPVPKFEGEVQNEISESTLYPPTIDTPPVPKFEGEVQSVTSESTLYPPTIDTPQVPKFEGEVQDKVTEVQVPPTVETPPAYDRADSQFLVIDEPLNLAPSHIDLEFKIPPQLGYYFTNNGPPEFTTRIMDGQLDDIVDDLVGEKCIKVFYCEEKEADGNIENLLVSATLSTILHAIRLLFVPGKENCYEKVNLHAELFPLLRRNSLDINVSSKNMNCDSRGPKPIVIAEEGIFFSRYVQWCFGNQFTSLGTLDFSAIDKKNTISDIIQTRYFDAFPASGGRTQDPGILFADVVGMYHDRDFKCIPYLFECQRPDYVPNQDIPWREVNLQTVGVIYYSPGKKQPITVRLITRSLLCNAAKSEFMGVNFLPGSGGVLDMDRDSRNFNYRINEKPFFPTYLAKDTSIIGIVLMRTRTQGLPSKASPQVRASPKFRSENILSTPYGDISMTVVMSVVDKNERIQDEGMDCCFGRTLDWFDRDRTHNILFHSSFFAYLTFDLSDPEQNYTTKDGATICFGDYVKAWANLFIQAHPHQLIHIPISYPTNQHWVYAFICKGERKVFLTDSMASSENMLFVFDRLLAFVEACMKFGNLVDPRSNEWTRSFIRTPLQKDVITCGPLVYSNFLRNLRLSQPFEISHMKEHPEKYDLPVLDTSDEVESFRKLMYKILLVHERWGVRNSLIDQMRPIMDSFNEFYEPSRFRRRK